MCIEEAEGYIFSPYSVEMLNELGLDSNVIRITKLGTELEDIQSLIPHKLKSNIHDLIEETTSILSELPTPKLPTEKILK